MILRVQIPQTSNYLFNIFQIPGTGGYKKETKYMINTGVKLTLIEPVTMHGIQFPPRWPAKRNDQKEISSTPLKMTQKVVHEETKAKQFFVGHDA